MGYPPMPQPVVEKRTTVAYCLEVDSTAPEWNRTAEATATTVPLVAGERTRPQRPRPWPRDAAPETIVLRVGLAIVALFMALTALDLGGQIVIWENAHWTAAGTLAALYAVLIARKARGTDRQIAILVAIGTLAWLIGQVAWNVQTALGFFHVPAPSDIGYLLVAPPIVIAFVVAVYGRLDKAEEVAVYLDAVAIFLALTAIILAVYGGQVGNGQTASGTVAIMYPIVHLAAAAAGLVALLAARAAPRGGGYLLLLGLAVLGLRGSTGFVRRSSGCRPPAASATTPSRWGSSRSGSVPAAGASARAAVAGSVTCHR